MRISAFNRSCERKQSHIYPSRSLKKVAISFDHDPILFSTANPADEVFGRHKAAIGQVADVKGTSAERALLTHLGHAKHQIAICNSRPLTRSNPPAAMAR